MGYEDHTLTWNDGREGRKLVGRWKAGEAIDETRSMTDDI
jgi:hypothetical protein